MQVCYCLPSVAPLVEDQAVAALRDALIARHFIRRNEKPRQGLAILRRGIGNAGDVLLGNDQHMGWGLGVQVAEGDHILVFIDACARQQSFGNLAEHAVGRWGSHPALLSMSLSMTNTLIWPHHSALHDGADELAGGGIEPLTQVAPARRREMNQPAQRPAALYQRHHARLTPKREA